MCRFCSDHQDYFVDIYLSNHINYSDIVKHAPLSISDCDTSEEWHGQ